MPHLTMPPTPPAELELIDDLLARMARHRRRPHRGPLHARPLRPLARRPRRDAGHGDHGRLPRLAQPPRHRGQSRHRRQELVRAARLLQRRRRRPDRPARRPCLTDGADQDAPPPEIRPDPRRHRRRGRRRHPHVRPAHRHRAAQRGDGLADVPLRAARQRGLTPRPRRRRRRGALRHPRVDQEPRAAPPRRCTPRR